MIWESHPWRDELERIADRFDSWREDCNDEDEQTSFEQERDVFLSAFILRKLIDAKKLPNSLVAATIDVDAYPLIERVPDHMNWHRLEEFYDSERRGTRTLTVEQLCNQFIHSFIFMVRLHTARTIHRARQSGCEGCSSRRIGNGPVSCFEFISTTTCGYSDAPLARTWSPARW